MPRNIVYLCAVCGGPADWQIVLHRLRLVPKGPGRGKSLAQQEWFCEEHVTQASLTWPNREENPHAHSK